MKPIDSIVSEALDIAQIRRDIHTHTELCFEKYRTSDIVIERPKAWGILFHRGLTTTGVVGIIHGRDDGACGRAVGHTGQGSGDEDTTTVLSI